MSTLGGMHTVENIKESLAGEGDIIILKRSHFLNILARAGVVADDLLEHPPCTERGLTVTQRPTAKDVSEAWAETYSGVEWENTEKEAIGLILKNLPDFAPRKAVDTIIGNKSWTEFRCDLCNEDSDELAEIKCNGNVLQICRCCMKDAIGQFKASAKDDRPIRLPVGSSIVRSNQDSFVRAYQKAENGNAFETANESGDGTRSSLVLIDTMRRNCG
ncbi:hypothetical protein [Roseibium sp.]|uniref:hypothetical protein n=1 Tax=Roseibium sp. TaxID=1936156 RepID=UPI003BAC254C